MKKTILSALLACLLVVSMLVYSGCATKGSVTDLDNKVNENANNAEAADKEQSDKLDQSNKDQADKIEAAKQELAKKAAEDLAAAKQALEKLIADGDKKNADAIAAAVDKLNAAVEAAKTAAKDADAALKDELTAAISDATKDIADAVKAHFEEWDATTDDIIDGALVELKNEFSKLEAKKNTYTEDGYAKVQELYYNAWIRIVRSQSKESADAFVEDFATEAVKVRTIVDEIYDALVEAEATLDKIGTYTGKDLYSEEGKALLDSAKAQLDKVKTMITDATALGNSDINDAIISYGEEKIDLSTRQAEDVTKYETYLAEYKKQEQIHGGEKIKADMDAALEQLITDKTDLSSLREAYDNWIAGEGNALENVEGFAETYAAFQKAEARIEALKTARTEAEALNDRIVALQSAIIDTGASKKNQADLEQLKADIDAWVDKYFADPYDAELPSGEEAGSANYGMIDHDKFANVVANYEEKVAAFRKAAEDFIKAYNSIPDPIDLLSGDEIQAAINAYNKWVTAEKLGDFDYALGGGKTPADYYDSLFAKKEAFESLCAPAYNDFKANVAPVIADGYVVTIYSQAEVDAAMAWFDTYKFDGKSGAFVYGDLTVDEATVNTVKAIKDNFDALAAAKVEETKAVNDAIAALGDITVSKEDAVKAAREAYDKWLNGTGVAEGFTAEQYKIDTAKDTYTVDPATLVAAEAKITSLKAELTTIHERIAALAANKDLTAFADKAARDTYKAELDAIAALIDTFKTNNGGNLEGQITDEENAKLADGNFAVAMFDEFEAVVAKIAEVKAAVSANAALTDKDKAMINGMVDKIGNEAKDSVKSATELAALKEISKLAITKLDGANETVAVYIASIDRINNDVTIVDKVTTLNKLYYAYENSLTNIKDAADDNTVTILQGLVKSELDAIKDEAPLTGYHIAYAASSVVFDGKKDAIYDQSTAIRTKDNRAVAYVVMDATGLYTYIEVTDDDVISGDKVTLFIDFDNNFDKIGCTSEEYRDVEFDGLQWAVSKDYNSRRVGYIEAHPGDTWTYGNWGFYDDYMKSKLFPKIVNTDTGFALEMYVPFSKAYLNPESIGLGLAFRDDAEDGTQEFFYDSEATEVVSTTEYGYEKLSKYKYEPATRLDKYDIAYNASSIVMDGVKDSAYEGALMIETTHPYSEGLAETGKAKAWFVAGKDGMYVYTEVVDNTLFDTKTEDKVQVYVDFVNDHNKSGMTGGSYMPSNRDNPYWNSNRIGYIEVFGNGENNIQHGFWQAGQDGVAKTAFKKLDDGTGYAAEIFFPYPEIGVNPVIGIGLQCQDDVDGNGSWDTLWYNHEKGSEFWSDYTLLPDFTIDTDTNGALVLPPVVIDGTKDEAYNEAYEIVSTTPLGGNKENCEAGTTAYVTSSGDILYFFAEIKDSTYSVNPEGIDQGDRIQVYMNMNDAMGAKTILWFNIGRDGAGAVAGWASDFADSLVAYKTKEVEGGYTVEAAFKLPAKIAENIKANGSEKIGIGLQTEDFAENSRLGIMYSAENGSEFWSSYDLPMVDVKMNSAFAEPKAPVEAEIVGDRTRFNIEKNVFVEGEPIYVTAIGEGLDWVGIVHSTGGSSIKYYYLGEDAEAGYGSGMKVDLRNAPRGSGGTYASFPAGEYTIYFFPNDGSYPNVEPFAYAEITIVAK